MTYIEVVQRMRKRADALNTPAARTSEGGIINKQWKQEIQRAKKSGFDIVPSMYRAANDPRIIGMEPTTVGKITDAAYAWNPGMSMAHAVLAAPVALASNAALLPALASIPAYAGWGIRNYNAQKNYLNRLRDSVDSQADTLKYNDSAYVPWQKNFYESRGWKQRPTGKLHPATGKPVMEWYDPSAKTTVPGGRGVQAQKTNPVQTKTNI